MLIILRQLLHVLDHILVMFSIPIKLVIRSSSNDCMNPILLMVIHYFILLKCSAFQMLSILTNNHSFKETYFQTPSL